MWSCTNLRFKVRRGVKECQTDVYLLFETNCFHLDHCRWTWKLAAFYWFIFKMSSLIGIMRNTNQIYGFLMRSVINISLEHSHIFAVQLRICDTILSVFLLFKKINIVIAKKMNVYVINSISMFIQRHFDIVVFQYKIL